MTAQAIDARRDELLSVKEYARLARFCEKTVYRRIWSGRQAGAVRVGGQWRIDVAIAVRPVQSCPADRTEEPAVA